MFKRSSFRTSKIRSALTLVELLIVMALMIILASISLGAMKSLLRGQKVSQASVMVRQYLQNAQMRAVASGRPVAVFFDRISMEDSAGSPIPTNYASTRMQFGEVFPPYTGDVENSMALLVGIPSDPNYANAMVFAPAIGQSSTANVAAGFGAIVSGNLQGGFVSVGDVVEFDDCEARFSITSITPNAPMPGGIQVTFSNPKIAPQIPLPGHPIMKRFRIYRQPTRSLVGSVVLPRGTCVDLSLSGIGISDCGISGGSFSIGSELDGGGTASPRDYSRVGIVFYSDGRIAYVADENTMRTPARVFFDSSSMIFLMVGRMDQVLPGFPASNIKTAALHHPDWGLGELPKSNLVDPENVWITCNPLTGEIRSAPVGALDPTVVEARWLSAQSNVNEVVSDLVIETRALAAAGMSN